MSSQIVAAAEPLDGISRVGAVAGVGFDPGASAPPAPAPLDDAVSLSVNMHFLVDAVAAVAAPKAPSTVGSLVDTIA